MRVAPASMALATSSSTACAQSEITNAERNRCRTSRARRPTDGAAGGPSNRDWDIGTVGVMAGGLVGSEEEAGGAPSSGPARQDMVGPERGRRGEGQRRYRGRRAIATLASGLGLARWERRHDGPRSGGEGQKLGGGPEHGSQRSSKSDRDVDAQSRPIVGNLHFSRGGAII